MRCVCVCVTCPTLSSRMGFSSAVEKRFRIPLNILSRFQGHVTKIALVAIPSWERAGVPANSALQGCKCLSHFQPPAVVFPLPYGTGGKFKALLAVTASWVRAACGEKAEGRVDCALCRVWAVMVELRRQSVSRLWCSSKWLLVKSSLI